MTDSKAKGSRAGAIARARSYVEDGAFEAELARRVAFRTESQLLPASLPELRRYLDEEMAPAFQRLGFTARIYDNPLPGPGPGAARHAHRGRQAADGAGLRPRRRHPRPGGAVDQGQRALDHRPRRRSPLRPRHRRQQRPAYPQHGGARRGAGRAGRQARLQCQVHDRDRRGGRLQGAGRAGSGQQGGLRRRCADRFGRPARKAGAADHDARLPGRPQFRSRLRAARGRASFRQLGRSDRQPRRHPRACAGLHRRAEGRAAGAGPRRLPP